jgi:ABC-type molybdenum transport system ATPase subunit/photorepair protein PhrA
MLARAIVSAPRLLLIDGTLDLLSDEDRHRVMRRLTKSAAENDDQAAGSPRRPWTLLVATGRRDVAQQCDRYVSLGKQEDAATAPSELLPTN